MEKCKKFINSIVAFIENNPVDDFEMTKEDTLDYIDWICYENYEITIYNEKYVKFSFGHSSAGPDLLVYNTFEELEKSLIDMMGNMFCSYNFPIINGEVPTYTMYIQEDEEWKVCHPNTLMNGEGKKKKIVWEEH